MYAVSDVHGYLDDLREGLREVGLLADDGDRWAGGDDELFVLGDLTDRGPDGIGVVRLLRDLQAQAPGRVHVVMGNHDAMTVGMHDFPQRFARVWDLNGGHASDQAALTGEEVAWFRELPVLARSGDLLLMHSDTRGYLELGGSLEAVNARVRELMAEPDPEGPWAVFRMLSDRYDFAGEDGHLVADELLAAFGGSLVVHGHSIIGTLVGAPSWETTGPIRYAEGRVVAIDGGRYDGGPLLVVRLT